VNKTGYWPLSTTLDPPAVKPSQFARLRVESDTQRLVDEAIGQYGRLDIVINNAAAPHGCRP